MLISECVTLLRTIKNSIAKSSHGGCVGKQVKVMLHQIDKLSHLINT